MEPKIEKKCFVLMPFTERLKEIYDQVYKEVCKLNNLKCWRVDEISRPGSITRDIIEGIIEADIIIADLTDKNSNVFYELGIAHSAGNKTIMTAQGIGNVPFDIASYRVILYDHTLRGCEKLKVDLDSAIKELVIALDRTNNPFQEVMAARGGMKLNRKTPLMKIIDYNKFSANVRMFLEEQGIMYAEDIKKLNLNALLTRPGFGKESLSQIVTLIIEKELYDNYEELHKFVAKNKIDTKNYRVMTALGGRRY
jgi:hypothetical protein